jgi:hypothetical protein
MKPTHKKRASDATRAEINESRRALVRSYQTASDFTDEDGRRVGRFARRLERPFIERHTQLHARPQSLSYRQHVSYRDDARRQMALLTVSASALALGRKGPTLCEDRRARPLRTRGCQSV